MRLVSVTMLTRPAPSLIRNEEEEKFHPANAVMIKCQSCRKWKTLQEKVEPAHLPLHII
jgi:hypothetical protein